MKIRWRLRMAAAQREVWIGTELRRLLAEKAGLELPSASVSALSRCQSLDVSSLIISYTGDRTDPLLDMRPTRPHTTTPPQDLTKPY